MIQKQLFLNRCFLKLHMKTSLLEPLFNIVAGLKAWKFIKKRFWHRYFLLNFLQFFRKPYLLQMTANTSKWLLLLIPPKSYPLITLSWFFPSFFSSIIDNCNYGSLHRKSLKMKIFLLFTIVYSKINIHVIKTILPQQ